MDCRSVNDNYFFRGRQWYDAARDNCRKIGFFLVVSTQVIQQQQAALPGPRLITKAVLQLLSKAHDRLASSSPAVKPLTFDSEARLSPEMPGRAARF
jgi:hypothetical protein